MACNRISETRCTYVCICVCLSKQSINGSRKAVRYKSDSSCKTQLGIEDERDERDERLIVRDQTSSLESFVHLRRQTTDYLHRLEFSCALI